VKWCRTSIVILCGVILLPWTGATAAAAGDPPPRSTLKTVEGEVLELGLVPGEGDMDVVLVSLSQGAGEPPLRILLAPPGLLAEIGFSLEAGDRLKIKYFTGEDETCKAHKVLNNTRGLMVRLRTLRQIPLWSNQGLWQGGPGRIHRGAASSRGSGPH
jgi:hypothetical protein